MNVFLTPNTDLERFWSAYSKPKESRSKENLSTGEQDMQMLWTSLRKEDPLIFYH